MPFLRGGEAGELFLLGKVIQDARYAAGLTQGDLATLVGRARITVSQWEIGLRAPNLLDMMRIAHACDLSLSALLSRLDSFEPPPLIAEEPPPAKTKKRWPKTGK